MDLSGLQFHQQTSPSDLLSELQDSAARELGLSQLWDCQHQRGTLLSFLVPSDSDRCLGPFKEDHGLKTGHYEDNNFTNSLRPNMAAWFKFCMVWSTESHVDISEIQTSTSSSPHQQSSHQHHHHHKEGAIDHNTDSDADLNKNMDMEHIVHE